MKLNLMSSGDFIVYTTPEGSNNIHMINVRQVNCIEDDDEYIYFKRSNIVVATFKKNNVLGYSKIGR